MVAVSVSAYRGAVSEFGLYEGEGEADFKVGHRYVGGFKHGKMHGRGRYEWVDGIVFEGHFRDNVAEGHGTYSWPDGARYEGQIRRGLRHGRGVMRFADAPTWYDGEWRDGMRHGRGVLAFDADASCRYDGEWARDKKHGRGTFVYASGNRYDGEWANDRKHGLGRMSWLDRGEAYDGEWRDGLPHGRGAHRWDRRGEVEDGAWFTTRNAYEGDFVEGRRSGHGAFSYATGATYVGQFADDEKHGVGSYTFEDGSVFRGEFLNDRAVTAPNGPPFAPTAYLRLDLEDLLREEPPDRRESVAAKIDHLALRYASELRALHRLAAVRAATKTDAMPSNPEKAVPLTIAGFLALMRVAGVTSADCTAADLARAIAPAWRRTRASARRAERMRREEKREAGFGYDALPKTPRRDLFASSAAEDSTQKDAGDSDSDASFDVLDPSVAMVYREFAEALVRAAHLRHHASPGLDRRFAKMLSDAALPALAPDAPDALPWDEDVAKLMLAGGSRGGGRDPRTHAAFASAATGGERADVRGRARSGGCLTVSGRAFLAYLASRGALADADDAEGETIEIEPPSGEGEEGGEKEEGAEEEEGAGGGEDGGADGGEEGDEEAGEENAEGGDAERDENDGAAEERGDGSSPASAPPPSPSLTTARAAAAFIAAIGPYAAHTAAIDEAEREAEEAAIEEEERQARYEAGEGSGGAEAALEDAAETADAAAAKAELAEARALAEGLDGEATFEEFVHALARCADAAFEGDEEKTTLEEKMDAFLGDEAFLGL